MANSINYDPDTYQVPSDIPFYIPVPLIQFSEIIKIATARCLREKLNNGLDTVQKLTDGYRLSKPAGTLLYFFITDYDYPVDLVSEDMADLKTTV